MVVRIFYLPLLWFIHSSTMKHEYNDGGRSAYTHIKSKHDCVVRALAITTGRAYLDVYRELHAFTPALESEGVNIRSANFTAYMRRAGFVMVEGTTAMQDIPEGLVVACTDGHYTAIVNGIIQDTHSEAHKAVTHYWVKGRLFDLYRKGAKLNQNPLNDQQAATMRRLFTLNYGAGVHIKAV